MCSSIPHPVRSFGQHIKGLFSTLNVNTVVYLIWVLGVLLIRRRKLSFCEMEIEMIALSVV